MIPPAELEIGSSIYGAGSGASSVRSRRHRAHAKRTEYGTGGVDEVADAGERNVRRARHSRLSAAGTKRSHGTTVSSHVSEAPRNGPVSHNSQGDAKGATPSLTYKAYKGARSTIHVESTHSASLNA